MPSININSVSPGSVVYMNGITEFSTITARLEGEALAAADARRVANGLRPIGKPHTSLSVHDVTISYADPSHPTDAELCVAERCFTSKKHPDNNLCYMAMNKSQYLPQVYCRDSITSTTLEPVALAGELAPGINVTLVLRFFETKQNNGISLDAVIVNEKPIRYVRAGNAMTNALQARGFTVMPATEGNVNDYRASLTADAVPVAPVPQPQAAPYMPQAAPAAAPAQQTSNPSMPVQSTAWSGQPAPNTTASAAQPANEEVAAPAAPSLPIPPAGYEYDPSGRIVPIGTKPAAAAPAGGITLT